MTNSEFKNILDETFNSFFGNMKTDSVVKNSKVMETMNSISKHTPTITKEDLDETFNSFFGNMMKK